MLDLLVTIGRARRGTRVIVAEPITVVNASEGGRILLPVGTMVEITYANGQSLSAIAEVGGGLHSVFMFVEHYPALAVES
jgi:hypothetical protein